MHNYPHYKGALFFFCRNESGLRILLCKCEKYTFILRYLFLYFTKKIKYKYNIRIRPTDDLQCHQISQKQYSTYTETLTRKLKMEKNKNDFISYELRASENYKMCQPLPLAVKLLSFVLHFKMESSRSFIENNFKCGICEKIFLNRRNRSYHIRSVHREPYRCDSCEKLFTVSGSLKKHIETIHEGQRNYKCDSCKKSYTRSQNLKKHIKIIHEGQRNHKCDSCGKSFTTSGSLKTHIKTLHEELRIN